MHHKQVWGIKIFLKISLFAESSQPTDEGGQSPDPDYL